MSVDEQTVDFQGMHVDKLRITYKTEGDGFQCDAICDDGYTFEFYFRNEPPPEKYKYLSPLHARVMSSIDSLKDKYHRIHVDNLYTSAKFFREAYRHPMKPLFAGVCRTSGRGLPNLVIQQEQKTREAQAVVRDTVKAAELVGDSECPALVAVSVYDTKPVHFLTMSCESIIWIKKERKVFDKYNKNLKPSPFFD